MPRKRAPKKTSCLSVPFFRTDIAQLEREPVLQSTLSFPTPSRMHIPRAVTLARGWPTNSQLASVTYFPEGAESATASTFYVTLSELGLRHLQAGKAVYCALDKTQGMWLEPVERYS